LSQPGERSDRREEREMMQRREERLAMDMMDG
jgi:hypothetical protein